jgi:succinate dehydrogenase flavin-adding protein (antitoxin of CptAB toxin-antitoxin module)
MLELDLVLNAFVERYLPSLKPHEFEVLHALLDLSDPELLDYLMGHAEPATAAECDLIGLMRSVNVDLQSQQSFTQAPGGQARGTIQDASGALPTARN